MSKSRYMKNHTNSNLIFIDKTTHRNILENSLQYEKIDRNDKIIKNDKNDRNDKIIKNDKIEKLNKPSILMTNNNTQQNFRKYQRIKT
jgi:hypothetical protein